MKQKCSEDIWLYWCFVKGFFSQLLCAVCTGIYKQNILAVDAYSNC